MDKTKPALVNDMKLLRADEVSEILSVSLAFAYRLIQNGEIPSVRMGSAVRVRPEDLTAYIEANLRNKFPEFMQG
jgi:excisionase family DNA binding protein